MESRAALLNRLDETVSQLLAYFHTVAPAGAPSTVWSGKDVLAHLTFWHASFARNVGDLAAGRTPQPLKGKLAELNQRGVDELRPLTCAELMIRFADAHEVIRRAILDPHITLIPYRKGSRDYTPEEHLAIVDAHIRKHLKELQRRPVTGDR
jgi:hypothetical protein